MERKSIAIEHVQVIQTLLRDKLISKHAAKSIKGQILSLDTFEEREEYLRKLIKSRPLHRAKENDNIV